MPQFTALNGIEYKKVILDRIEAELEESGLFKQNLTYPWIKWGFVFKHTSYPQAPMEQEPRPVVTIPEEVSSIDILEPPVENRTVAVVDHTAVIDTPDQARVDSSQPVPTPVPLIGIGIVDKPIMQAPAANKNKTHGK